MSYDFFLSYDHLNHRTEIHHPLEPAAVGRLSYGRCRMSSRMKAKTTLYILLLDATWIVRKSYDRCRCVCLQPYASVPLAQQMEWKWAHATCFMRHATFCRTIFTAVSSFFKDLRTTRLKLRFEQPSLPQLHAIGRFTSVVQSHGNWG
jgi:hypothetical protein